MTHPTRAAHHAPSLLLAAVASLALVAAAPGCLSEEPTGLRAAPEAVTTVQFDWFDKPLPNIPLPNDVATRADETSPTGRRLNASLLASTAMERQMRALFDELDGWGVYAPITVPFTGPLGVESIRAAHCRFEPEDTTRTHCKWNPDHSDDVIYLLDVDPRSPDRGKMHPLDIGHGNFPVVLRDIHGYWPNDPRGWTISVLFEEEDEDLNGNGILDPGEDTDLDGVLDRPNYLPGHHPARDDLRARADALMTFYERETHTLIVRPLFPLRERTTYAVVVTRRLLDAAGRPVGSPFDYVHHLAQSKALADLPELLPEGLAMADVAFAWSFTTGSIESDWHAVREGLYGHGVQGHLAEDFPAEIADIAAVRPGAANPYIMHTEEWISALELVATALLGANPDSEQTRELVATQSYIDFHVVGSFRSPQLFERVDDAGELLPLNLQSWPNDLEARPVNARSEDVHFWLTVPRKEISARGEGRPAPIAVLIHGYGSNRFEALTFSGFFARLGIATLAIDCVSHGIGLSPSEAQQAQEILGLFGLGEFMEAMLTGRAFDQNNSGVVDSGADFWTAYLFHTRDVVRQSALDHLQLIRILRTFDGVTRWHLDTSGDGTPNLAGDFNGDGMVDVGLDGPLSLVGGSLGGIMSTIIGAVEPTVDVIIPIAGGGGLGDVGIRSVQGGVREAVLLRLMGPLYLGDLDAETGDLALRTAVPDLTRTAQRPLGVLSGAEPGDTVLARNLGSGTVGCGLVQPNGALRVQVESDRHDETVFELYRGLAVVNGSSECDLIEGAEPIATLSTLAEDIVFQGDTYAAGEPIVALAEGLGRHRARPELRRLLSLAQVALDRADPAVFAERLERRPIVYPHTGEVGGANALVVTTLGDMNVPASTGGSIARAAGFVEVYEDDPRYGKPPNQVLIDTGTYEAVHTLSRFKDASGTPVILDVENFSGGEDMWGDSIPRLDPPLRLVRPRPDCEAEPCPITGAIFPFPRPEGQHGFAFPGELTDRSRAACRAACDEEGSDPCGCLSREWFDIGRYMFGNLAEYMLSGGTQLSFDECHARNACPGFIPEAPAARPISSLR